MAEPWGPRRKLLLSIKEAAERLNVGRDFLYEEARSGRIRTIQVGRKRLVPEEELTAWIHRRMGLEADPGALTEA